jgi:hypothetical protein
MSTNGRLSKQFSGSQAAFETNFKITGDYRKAGKSFLKRLIGRISQLVSKVIEVSRNLGFYVFVTKRQPNFSRSPTFPGCFL